MCESFAFTVFFNIVLDQKFSFQMNSELVRLHLSRSRWQIYSLSIRHSSLAAARNCCLKSDKPLSSSSVSVVGVTASLLLDIEEFLCNHCHSSLEKKRKTNEKLSDSYSWLYFETLATDRILMQGNDPGRWRWTITRTQSTLFCIFK